HGYSQGEGHERHHAHSSATAFRRRGRGTHAGWEPESLARANRAILTSAPAERTDIHQELLPRIKLACIVVSLATYIPCDFRDCPASFFTVATMASSVASLTITGATTPA